MPRADQLPTPLTALARRQAVELSHKQWEATTGELVRTLEKIFGSAAPRSAGIGDDERARHPDDDRPRVAAGETGGHTGGGRGKWWLGGAGVAAALIAVALYLTYPWSGAPESPPRPGHLMMSPGKLEFPDQRQSSRGPAATITLRNDGESPLRVTGPRLDGAAAEFALADDECSGRTGQADRESNTTPHQSADSISGAPRFCRAPFCQDRR